MEKLTLPAGTIIPMTIGLICFLLLSFSYSTAMAAEVSATFHQEKENISVIEINRGKKAPSTLIVQMFLPSGVRITESTPAISKFDKKKNSAKWLLREIPTGRTIITVRTSKLFNIDNCVVKIRYRNRGNGNMSEIEAIRE